MHQPAGLDRSTVRCRPADRLGWQPSRFLTDRGEAERAFQLAERLGSVNAASAELGTTWPSLRKAFTRHRLGMPARNPQAVREQAIEAARQRSGRPATPSLDPVFVALNCSELPVRARSGGELAERVRRAEDYAALGAKRPARGSARNPGAAVVGASRRSPGRDLDGLTPKQVRPGGGPCRSPRALPAVGAHERRP